MAKFRQVHVEFWQDGFILDLKPEEKYFYIYLMTNSKTSQCGIYELPKRIIETETGYDRGTVEKLLQRFIDYGKIKYDDSTKEIMILNWIKYNAIKSPKVESCIKKELETVKNKEFIRTFINLCKQYGYHIDTLSIDLGEEKEEEVEEEKEKEVVVEEYENLKNTTTTENPIQLFERLLCRLSPNQMENLLKWQDDFNGQAEIINEAIRIADDKNKRYFGFVEFLLKEWANNKLNSLDRVKAYEQEKFNRQKKTRQGFTPLRQERLPSWFDKQHQHSNVVPISSSNSESMEETRKRLEAIRNQYKKSGS